MILPDEIWWIIVNKTLRINVFDYWAILEALNWDRDKMADRNRKIWLNGKMNTIH